MFREKELFEKIKGHIKDTNEYGRDNIIFLNTLISDVDEFNAKSSGIDRLTEIYIDFDDIGTGSEFDPYETFSIRIKTRGDESLGTNVYDCLDLDGLDTMLAGIVCYQSDRDEIIEPLRKKLSLQNDDIFKKIQEEGENGNIVFKSLEGLAKTSLQNFTKQALDGQLYDLNRLPEVTDALKDEDWVAFRQKWINDLALVNLLKYYYNRTVELEAKLAKSENTLIEKEIMK